MFKGLNYTDTMMILVYPNNQKEEVNIFLSPVDFKKPEQLINTHCTEVITVWQTKEQTRTREVKTPQLIKEFELIVRNSDTEDSFSAILNSFKEYAEGINITQILKLYCVFDEAIANCSIESLILAERTSQNYIESQSSAA
ncbi:hypothetical protein G7B40_037975 [Aetokthonos hydrillicola Thurmond2011]|jgi:sulfite reductase alpha subunit-like flavoprotein|uniref:Uncharacterized protein n=1 Tax=Aetokthonos hydrillicola Thurmond2011 TaxID=2712845 RepID=A0AAP5IGY2_9CYAN|nr:hypothetical protein [Aetokthonos hydrillicola]MBO3463101.1 hypothetical protein [Aetokthonos hydrillicola CCALA 1050]MDR9900297.1 hypothetical protein [Aetokthonos hydrillicola Thurmond2011]